MHLVKEILPETWLIQLKCFEDTRGVFVKTYVRSFFDAELGAIGTDGSFDFWEEFYSVSNRDVLRGMHFQLPPHDHVKLVYCAVGTVQDVLLDLRRGTGYGRSVSVRLDANAPQLLVIPKGVAHGFLSLVDGSLMVYKTSTEYASTHDAGIRYDSFEYNWSCASPILSLRDQGHPAFVDFESPF
jgi:dTDP-4-dehydrorhamnose 3,5-epimerase